MKYRFKCKILNIFFKVMNAEKLTFHFIKAKKRRIGFLALEKMTFIKFFFRRIFESVAKRRSFFFITNVCLNNLYACWQSNRNISAGYEP